MAWITPKTDFAPGDVLTAAQMNNIGSDLTTLRGDYASSRYTAGDVTLNSTTWANVGGPADLVLAASTGDVIEVNFSARFDNGAVQTHLDVVTMVGGSPVNSFANAGATTAGTQGIISWTGFSGQFASIGGAFYYKLVSGDISSNTVTLRLRYQTASATNRTLYANANYAQVFFARNHGPVEI
jgi:hypothetical protein